MVQIVHVVHIIHVVHILHVVHIIHDVHPTMLNWQEAAFKRYLPLPACTAAPSMHCFTSEQTVTISQ